MMRIVDAEEVIGGALAVNEAVVKRLWKVMSVLL